MKCALFAVFLFAAAAASCAAADAAAESPARHAVLEVARGLIGTTEATGCNDGPVVEEILRRVGAEKGEPYCAAFNFYCYARAGFGALVPRSAWSPDWVARPTWTRAAGGATPRPADAFGIWFASKGRVAHTGLVEQWGATTVRTIEANTSPEAAEGSAADRNGDGIWSKRRLRRQIYAVRDWIGPRL